MDLSKELKSLTRFKLLMKLRELSPNNKFDEAFDVWVLDTYGIRMRYDMADRPLVMTGIEISDEDYTMLLLRLGHVN
jgi:hypothetical protein